LRLWEIRATKDVSLGMHSAFEKGRLTRGAELIRAATLQHSYGNA